MLKYMSSADLGGLVHLFGKEVTFHPDNVPLSFFDLEPVLTLHSQRVPPHPI